MHYLTIRTNTDYNIITTYVKRELTEIYFHTICEYLHLNKGQSTTLD